MEFLKHAGWHVDYLVENGQGDTSYIETAALKGFRGVARVNGSHEGLPPSGDLDVFFRKRAYDLVVIQFWGIAQRYLPAIRRVSQGTRIMIATIDLHFLREFREESAARGADEHAELREETGVRMVQELNTYAAADAVITVSEKETTLVEDLLSGPGLTHYVPWIVDVPASRVPVADRRGILFVGNFTRAPNVTAVEYLFREIVPYLSREMLQRHPIMLVGDGLDGSEGFLPRHPAVQVVGRVPDMTPYYQAARVNLLPLLAGAGVKQKLLEASMAGTPSVSTSIGIEGTGLEPGASVRVADEPEEFARQIELLTEDDSLWGNVAQGAQRQVTGSHAPDVVRGRFLDVVDCVMGKPDRR